MSGKSFEEVYAELRRTFVASTRERLVRMRKIFDAIAAETGDVAEGVLALRRDAHGLRGLGGTYGYPLVTEAADRLETLTTDRIQLEAEALDKARALIDAIEQAIGMDGKPEAAVSDAFVRSLPVVDAREK